MIPEGFSEGAAELHHFSDASSVGYGDCMFIRVINQMGRIHVALLLSKGRLAPLKQMTIPRLELCAAAEAVKLDNLARRELDIPIGRSTFWTDSQCRSDANQVKRHSPM